MYSTKSDLWQSKFLNKLENIANFPNPLHGDWLAGESPTFSDEISTITTLFNLNEKATIVPPGLSLPPPAFL